MNAIIIDDETKARENIINLIHLTQSDIQILDQASNVKSAFESIKLHNPDLIFLDIQMPDGTGFDLLKLFNKIEFQIIFITAFDQFAIDAFKYNAVDYLLKPINPIDFLTAINRSKTRIDNNALNIKIQNLLNSIEKTTQQKIILRTSEAVHLVNIDEIIHCESDKGYTTFYLTNNHKILVSSVLKNFSTVLPSHKFIRTHQSHLVNIDFVDCFLKGDGGYLKLKNGDTVPVSQRKRDEIISLMEKSTS